ncbi:hypothetical protein BDN72DRAFT_902912 [Pluteus cervinus]|uniref:Uncharacterized protein n=1 Tax=Pluteus cervinus TaxID=181527 RepID=A0ACD3AB40_9AGAR|nr:hypothetical protein BDN72DRAFT_902912 [Pluteus cervinus]
MPCKLLPNPLRPSDLFKDPKLLLHKQPGKDDTLSAYDGEAGAIFEEGESFITSSNHNAIYEPMVGNRRVFLRRNLRYGPDDPLEWPQVYIPYYGHYATIRSPVHDPGDPLYYMSWLPEKEDLHYENSLIDGIGRLKSMYLNTLKTSCQDLLKRKEESPYKTDSDFIPVISTLLADYLYCLEHISTDFGTTRRHLRSFQRAFLELLALLDFLEIYKPLLDGLDTAPQDELAPVMGCFVYHASDAEMFHRARIRVWFIRPCKELRNARVRRVAPFVRPELCITVDPAPNAPAIFTGPATDSNKYRVMFTHLLRSLRYQNPFSSIHSYREPDTPSTSTAPLKKPFNPAEAPTQKNSAGRDKFIDPVWDHYPPPIPSWKGALSRVPRPENFGGAASNNSLGYALPEPALFAAVESAILYHVTCTNSTAAPLPGSWWKKLLALEYEKQLKESGETSTGNSRGGGRGRGRGGGRGGAKLGASMQQYLQSTIDNVNANADSLTDVQLSLSSEEKVATWNGKAFNILTSPQLEEILWELAKLNFRFELIALDARATGTPQASSLLLSRQHLIESCFPLERRGTLFVADLAQANCGLANPDWRERGKFLVALAEVMKAWNGDKPASFYLPFRSDEKSMKAFEDDVTSFYTCRFFHYFNRAAIIPRRLSHSFPTTATIQDLNGITFLNPDPRIFYDLTQLDLGKDT